MNLSGSTLVFSFFLQCGSCCRHLVTHHYRAMIPGILMSKALRR